jgi:hypothetical protein
MTSSGRLGLHERKNLQQVRVVEAMHSDEQAIVHDAERLENLPPKEARSVGDASRAEHMTHQRVALNRRPQCAVCLGWKNKPLRVHLQKVEILVRRVRFALLGCVCASLESRSLRPVSAACHGVRNV